jgi:threonine dehydrogenase-like Zn-dependent dehydrogenase
VKAIALVPSTAELGLIDRPEPLIAEAHDVKLQVLRVGICGTDREEAAGGRAAAPPGRRELIIGHEMLGRVVEIGSAVSAVRPGDLATLTVRRECGHCPACVIHRSDMCYSGDYADRGIKREDGYQAEYVVDSERYALKIPADAASVGVLAEPMSIAQKAISEALQLQAARLPDMDAPEQWLRGRLTLVAGLGPVGLLAAFALRLRGAEVLGLDVVNADSRRATLLERIGGKYVDGRKTGPAALGSYFGEIELILEATGVAHLEFDLLSALGRNGIYVLTGLPGGDRPVSVDAPALVRGLVLGNQVMVGSVNASYQQFEAGIDDLQNAVATWGEALSEMITHRFKREDFRHALTEHRADEIKAVIEWA